MPKTERATNWSVTINNPIKADEENIALARQKGWKVEGQLERGENGTPHYQLAVRTPQVRFSAVKKQFPRAHIEVARNSAALLQYVKKEETREAQLTTEQSQYPSQQQIWQWFAEYRSYDQLREDFTNTVGTTQRFVDWVTNTNQMLDQFDAMISRKIEEGYYCELIGINPQIRSAVKRYGLSILKREVRRQTDRQTLQNVVSSLNITNGVAQEDRIEEAEWVEEEDGSASSHSSDVEY